MLEPVFQLEATETIEGIPQLPQHSGGRLIIDRRQIALEKLPAQAEHTDAPVDPVRLVQVHQRAIDVAEEIAKPVALEGRQFEQREMVLEQIREQEVGTLRGPQ